MLHQCSPRTHPPIPAPEGGWVIPQPGDVVDYRGDCAAELLPGAVVEVDMDDVDRDDSNVWGAPDEFGVVRVNPFAPFEDRVLLPDPRPNVSLQLDDESLIVTRAIRYRDSPGWSWPGQES